jgi:hypothetical protein
MWTRLRPFTHRINAWAGVRRFYVKLSEGFAKKKKNPAGACIDLRKVEESLNPAF